MRRCLEHKNISKTTDRMGIDMKRRGFSLIELLVTVLITSIIVIAAYQLLTSTANSFGDEDNRRLLEANLRNAELLIQRDISRTGYAYGFSADGSVATGEGRLDNGICRATGLSVPESGNSFMPKQLAFKHAVDNNGNSAIQIIASISDYDDFTVSSYSSNTVTLDRTVTLPLVANQVYKSSVDGSNLSNSSADQSTFMAIFNRMFRGASAVEVSTPDTGTAVILISDVKNEDASFKFIGDTRQFTRYCGIDPERPFVENTVNPITVITYRLRNSQLERCISNVISDDFVISDSDICDVLLDNVVYFNVYPIKYADFQDMGFSANYGYAVWNGMKMRDLYGAMFRIGALAQTSLKQIPDASSDLTDKYKRFDADTGGIKKGVYLMSHVRGAALFQEPRKGNVTIPKSTDYSDKDIAHGQALAW